SRSFTSKSGSPFCGLRTTATTSASNSLEARSATSRWPLWNGSKEPGNKAMVNRGPSRIIMAGPSGFDQRDERTAVAVLATDQEALGDTDRRRGLQHSEVGAQQS